MTCAIANCQRVPRPGFGVCDHDAARLLRAFGPAPKPMAVVERLSVTDPFCQDAASKSRSQLPVESPSGTSPLHVRDSRPGAGASAVPGAR